MFCHSLLTTAILCYDCGSISGCILLTIIQPQHIQERENDGQLKINNVMMVNVKNIDTTKQMWETFHTTTFTGCKMFFNHSLVQTTLHIPSCTMNTSITACYLRIGPCRAIPVMAPVGILVKAGLEGWPVMMAGGPPG